MDYPPSPFHSCLSYFTMLPWSARHTHWPHCFIPYLTRRLGISTRISSIVRQCSCRPLLFNINYNTVYRNAPMPCTIVLRQSFLACVLQLSTTIGDFNLLLHLYSRFQVEQHFCHVNTGPIDSIHCASTPTTSQRTRRRDQPKFTPVE
jgi:hypothetical protein